jgi:phosphoesterase RecJ-like protein
MGIYADTGGFKYSGVNSHTYEVAAKLVKSIPDVSKLIMNMEFSNTRGLLDFEAAALSKIEVIGSGQFAISTVPYSVLKEKNIPATDARTSEVSSFMLTVAEWQVTASVAELQPIVIKFSFRSKDIDKYDVAKLTALLGGGGHRAAAGLILKMPLEEAKKLVVSKAKELYNL